jgi:hypothetical protein
LPASRTAAAAAVVRPGMSEAGSISVTPEQLIWLASTATALLQGSNVSSNPGFNQPGGGLVGGTKQRQRGRCCCRPLQRQ